MLSICTAAQEVAVPLLANEMGNIVTGADQGRDCGAAEIQRLTENAPRWPDMNTYSREGRLLQPSPMAVEPLAIVLSWSGWRHVEGRLTPRFRTFQVCPKDLPVR